MMIRMALLICLFTQDLIKNQVALNVFSVLILFVSYPLCLKEKYTAGVYLTNCLIIVFLNLLMMLYGKLLNTLAKTHIDNFNERNSMLYIQYLSQAKCLFLCEDGKEILYSTEAPLNFLCA